MNSTIAEYDDGIKVLDYILNAYQTCESHVMLEGRRGLYMARSNALMSQLA